MNTEIKRSILQYQGAKFRLAPWIIQFFPEHECYVEPFGGAAGVLLRKDKSKLEVYNDLNSKVVNFFRVMRDEKKAEKLSRLLELTPYSREEYQSVYDLPNSEDDVEMARRLLVKSYMSYYANGATRESRQGFGARLDLNSMKLGMLPVFNKYTDLIPAFCKRLKTVFIENKDALQVIDNFDNEKTLFFVDPPYMNELWDTGTGRNKSYTCDIDHRKLLERLKVAKAKVVLCGYDNEIYNQSLSDWRTKSKETRNCINQKRVEKLWLNFDENGKIILQE